MSVPNSKLVRMASTSAIRNGQMFVLMKLITNQHCTKGNFFVNLNKMFEDAPIILQDFLNFEGNSPVCETWEMAAKSIAPLLQTIPANIHPDFAPSACRKAAYLSLLNSSNLNYCECFNSECDVNISIDEFLKVLNYIKINYHGF